MNLPYNINLLWPKLSGGNINGLGGNPNQQSEKFDKFHRNHEKPWNHTTLLDNWIAKFWENRQNKRIDFKFKSKFNGTIFHPSDLFCGKF